MNVSIKGLGIKALINIYLILVGHCVFSQLSTILSWIVVKKNILRETEFASRNNLKLRPVHQILSQFE